MKVAATQSPGEGGLRQRGLRKELTSQVGGTARKPACLRRMSREFEGAGLRAVGNGWLWDGSHQTVQSREGMWSDVELRDSSDGHWRGDRRSSSVQFSSVTQSCPTLCDPMNRSSPGLPVHHQLPEFTQTHVHRVHDAIQPSHTQSSPSPPAPNSSQHQSLFQ